tara:strand:+ start:500 stop:811 length:312 start_codon:yes stop_codon:yes gene_type:complete
VLIRRLTVPHIAHRARGNLACVVVPCGADASPWVARLVRLGVAAMVSPLPVPCPVGATIDPVLRVCDCVVVPPVAGWASCARVVNAVRVAVSTNRAAYLVRDK